MIVRDEEEYLPGCLESVRGVVDEIVVVDTGSRDRTVEVARGYGAKVYFYEWRDDFAAARNESLRHTSSEWILWLDADERLSEPSRRVIRRLLRISDYMGYALWIRSPIGEMAPGMAEDVHSFVRLFRNHPGVTFEGVVHEQVVPSIKRLGGKIAQTDLEIIHLGYALDREAMDRKHRRNLTLLERQVAEQPDFALGYFHLGQAYYLCGRYPEAREAFKRALNLAGLERGHIANIHLNLASIHLKGGHLEEAQQEAEQVLALQPEAVLPRFFLARIDYERGHYRESIRQLEATLTLSRSEFQLQPDIIERRVNPLVLYILMGDCYRRLGEKEQAKSCYREAITAKPNSAEAHLALAKCYFEDGQYEIALQEFARVLEHAGPRGEGYSRLILKYLRCGLGSEGFRGLTEALYPQMVPSTPAPHFPSISSQVLSKFREALERHLISEEVVWYAVQGDAPSPEGEEEAEHLYRRGLVLLKQKRYPEAVHSFQQALGFRPEHVPSHLYLAVAYHLLGQKEEAIAWYKSAMALDPALAVKAHPFRRLIEVRT